MANPETSTTNIIHIDFNQVTRTETDSANQRVVDQSKSTTNIIEFESEELDPREVLEKLGELAERAQRAASKLLRD